MANRDKQQEELKQIVTNPKSKVVYHRGKFLGKGGYARCYEFKNTTTNELYAGKVIPKSRLLKSYDRERLVQEIQIHSSLSYKYIVSLHSYFEDESNMYIIMELCQKRSLMEMHKRRKTLTLPEVRYFMRQIVLACKYMHDTKVIHRDLKLGNIFINDDMDVKVGDFGLATRITHDGERKETLCGTPNYIAPEILNKKGHSYEVDLWSLGCIMYTLLVGSPPFETSTLTSTYTKIKKCEYYLPPKLDHSARNLIQKLLNREPDNRPSADTILMDDFLTSDYILDRLPTSCLIMQPRFNHDIFICEVSRITRNPLTDAVNLPAPNVPKQPSQATNELDEKVAKIEEIFENQSSMPKNYHLGKLLSMLKSVIASKPESKYTGQAEDAQDPSAVPFVWISKWADYSGKYGIGYQLCDNSIGVFFNDDTHLVLLQDGNSLQYIERNCEEQYYRMENFPAEMNKKITLLKHFKFYMMDNLVEAGETAKPRKGDELAHVPHLRALFRTEDAIIFHLSNGTLQVNFFKDHTKIILCPLMGAVSLIDEQRNFTVYTFELIEKFGCSHFLASRMLYVKTVVEKLYKGILKKAEEKVLKKAEEKVA